MPAPKHNANTASYSVSKHFADQLAALGPFEPRPHLAVAFSGGADSTALLLLARGWALTNKGTITALIVDHRLREESTREAKTLAASFDAIVLTPEHVATSNNRIGQAREWRYDALTAWCRAHDVLHLLVAHHADDQAETVALHTERGATEDGGSGMAGAMLRDGVRILRPLLGIHKSALIDYLRTHDVRWVEDPTNGNLTFRRNVIRAAMREDDTHRLLRIAAQEGAARATRDATFAAAAAQVATVTEDIIALDADAFFLLPKDVATRLLADALCVVSGEHTRPRRHETEQLFHALGESGFRRGTLKHCLIEKRSGILHITPEPHKAAAERHPKVLAASPFWWLNPLHL